MLRVRRRPPLIRPPRHRRAVRCIGSNSIGQLACGAQIPIEPAAPFPPTMRGFLPWRLSDAGPVHAAPPSWAGIRNPSHKATSLTQPALAQSGRRPRGRQTEGALTARSHSRVGPPVTPFRPWLQLADAHVWMVKSYEHSDPSFPVVALCRAGRLLF